MDYYKPMRDEYIHNEMYPTEYRKDYFPKGASNDSLKFGNNPPCAPKFVTKIEGNAVEEGARVFFEGIVKAHPQPVFTWFFDDEEIFPGEPGWEDVEIHHSRKMSTLILTYAREHHMGKYSLLAKNRLGRDISNCDLIVRKKQFPPVFWKRIQNLELSSGSRLVAEVEVGGWPLPEITWYKDDEVVVSRVHTENYNGFPNKYVPERRIEVRRIDEIRYSLVFHRISENDSGVYTCRAINPLGEAECVAEFVILPGEGGTDDLYLPDKWLTGNRLTWKDEDKRMKPFVGLKEPGLTEEDIANMMKGVATTPLPRSMEYMASLPDYQPKPMSSYGFVPMNFSPESGLKNTKPQTGQKGGKLSRPSKFVPGEMIHYGYGCDDFGRILPLWINPLDQNPIDPWDLEYNMVDYIYPDVPPRPPRAKSPDGPPVWESQADLDRLHAMLAQSSFKLDLAAIRRDQLGPRRQVTTGPLLLHDQVKARKNLMQNTPKRGDSAAAKEWEERLNADAAGAQSNAEDFTRQFMDQIVYGNETSTTTVTQVVTNQENEGKQEKYQVQSPPVETLSPPPALPPKTKIMFSPSRDVFSPTNEEMQPRVESPKEYIPVKEKAKMIAQQQEEFERREEISAEQADSSSRVSGDTLKGGVRILPPSPTTVRKEKSSSSTTSGTYSQHQTMETTSITKEIPSYIPVLEDKYHVQENLEELGDNRPGAVSSPLTTQRQQHVTFRTSTMSSSSIPSSSYQGKKSQSSYCMIISGDQQGNQSPSRMVVDYASQMRGGYNRSRTASTEAEFEVLVKEQEAEDKRRAIQNQQVREQYEASYHQQQQPSELNREPLITSPTSSLSLRPPSQSPIVVDEDKQPQYRTPPQTPFQPAFYKTPTVDADRAKNPDFKLPSQKTKTSNQRWTKSSPDGRTITTTTTTSKTVTSSTSATNEEDQQYDGDSEF